MSDLLWIHYARPRTPWYELTDQNRSERRTAWSEVRDTSRATGGRCIGTFSVRGQSDYSTAEVWTFPTADDAFDHWARLTAAGYAEWFAFSNHVGSRTEAGA